MAWRDRLDLLRSRELTLGTLFERVARVHGDSPLVEEDGDDGLRLTYNEAADLTARWAGAQTRPRKARRIDPALAERARTSLEALTGATVKVSDTRIEIPFADEVALAEIVESLEARP